MTGYELSRNWFDWCFENPELISPNHSAIFFFAIEHCNRLGWKAKFGFPTQMAMDALGIKKHETYIRYFNDIVTWGFFTLVQKSTNQYSSNIISLVCAMPKNGKALEKAIRIHTGKQIESMGESNSSIYKQDNKELITIELIEFDIFWNMYNKRNDKVKCQGKWKQLDFETQTKIMAFLPKYISATPDIQFRKNPLTFFNAKTWNDELQSIPTSDTKHVSGSIRQ